MTAPGEITRDDLRRGDFRQAHKFFEIRSGWTTVSWGSRGSFDRILFRARGSYELRKKTILMKTNLLKHQSILQRLTRFPKLLLLAGIAAVMALPQAEARPGGHHHHGGGDSRGGYYRPSYGYGPQYRPGPRYVTRGWSRPGFYGAYPHAGYVDYRYIHSLPRGYRPVYRGGHRYYYANGSYYWPARYNNSGVFIQVRF
jgi:hypothetical protein